MFTFIFKSIVVRWNLEWNGIVQGYRVFYRQDKTCDAVIISYDKSKRYDK